MEEREKELERLSRLIATAMGDNPDVIVTKHNLPITRSGWQVLSSTPVQPAWSIYWHAAVAILDDEERLARQRKGT